MTLGVNGTVEDAGGAAGKFVALVVLFASDSGGRKGSTRFLSCICPNVAAGARGGTAAIAAGLATFPAVGVGDAVGL